MWVTFRPNRWLYRCPPIGPVVLHELTDVLYPAIILNNALRVAHLFSESLLIRGQPLPAELLGKRLRVVWLGEQNTTKRRSSRRREYVSWAADKLGATLCTSSLFLKPNTISAAKATWYGQFR